MWGAHFALRLGVGPQSGARTRGGGGVRGGQAQLRCDRKDEPVVGRIRAFRGHPPRANPSSARSTTIARPVVVIRRTIGAGWAAFGRRSERTMGENSTISDCEPRLHGARICAHARASGPTRKLPRRTFGPEARTTRRAASPGRTSRIPTPPPRPNRGLSATRHSCGHAPCSLRTSRASSRPGSWASSFGGSPRADARSIRARRPPFASAETSSPACRAGRGDEAGSDSRASAPPAERLAPVSYPFREPDASARTASHRSGGSRGAGHRSSHKPARATTRPMSLFDASSMSGQG